MEMSTFLIGPALSSFQELLAPMFVASITSSSRRQDNLLLTIPKINQTSCYACHFSDLSDSGPN